MRKPTEPAAVNPLERDTYSQALDYELQLAFVIGEPLHDAAPADSERAITAFAVMCDFSARDVQIPEMRSGMGPQKAKHFLSSMATVAVSADEVLPRWRDLRGRRHQTWTGGPWWNPCSVTWRRCRSGCGWWSTTGRCGVGPVVRRLVRPG